jgi:hypothetical protein
MNGPARESVSDFGCIRRSVHTKNPHRKNNEVAKNDRNTNATQNPRALKSSDQIEAFRLHVDQSQN